MFARVSVKKHFSKYFRIFSLEPKFFFFQIIHFKLFLFQKHYIYTCKKNLHKIAMSANSSGGRCLGLSGPLRMQVFFTCFEKYVEKCLHVHKNIILFSMAFHEANENVFFDSTNVAL